MHTLIIPIFSLKQTFLIEEFNTKKINISQKKSNQNFKQKKRLNTHNAKHIIYLKSNNPIPK